MSWITSSFAVAVAMAVCGYSAEAADFSGLWVSNPSACNKVFIKKGGEIRFADDADLYGSGFIIDGDQIQGKMATCKIRARKEDGDTVHLLSSCATDIMFSDNQFSLKIVDQNKISRVFPGMSELNTDYFRCQL